MVSLTHLPGPWPWPGWPKQPPSCLCPCTPSWPCCTFPDGSWATQPSHPLAHLSSSLEPPLSSSLEPPLGLTVLGCLFQVICVFRLGGQSGCIPWVWWWSLSGRQFIRLFWLFRLLRCFNRRQSHPLPLSKSRSLHHISCMKYIQKFIQSSSMCTHWRKICKWWQLFAVPCFYSLQPVRRNLRRS